MLLQLHPADGGMAYTETNLQHLFPEPLNMVTSALFLIPALYWIIKMKGFNRQYTFLSIAMWLLLVGCIGSTLYHGFRRWEIFIMMDWGPIAMLCLIASIYFWFKLSGKGFYGVLALLVFLAIEVGIHILIPPDDNHLGISLNYAVMVLMVLLPLTLLLIKMKGRNSGLVILSLVCFSIALFFRVADKWQWVSFGTHFLWHTFGAIATSAIFVFIYRLNHYEIKDTGKEEPVQLKNAA
jgi:predicted membrane channel-forming protein YqfA (hemolysin III family)